MDKIKFGTAKIAQEDGTVKEYPIEWWVLDNYEVYRKMWRTDEKEQSMRRLLIIPTCNLGLLTADELHELVYTHFRWNVSGFCERLFMKDLFNRSEQEKIMRAMCSYGNDKNMRRHMSAYLPNYDDIEGSEINFALVDGTGSFDTLTKVNRTMETITVFSSATNFLNDIHVAPTYGGKQSSNIALRPVIQIVLPESEFEELKV